jgi:glycosyltransferase involved in cell wall biosynthesis
MQDNLKINYYGYFTPFGGYGIANINWVKHLRRLGVDVSVDPKFAPVVGSAEWNILSDEEREMFKEPYEKRRVGIIESNPFDFERNKSDIRIANTMCETDILGPEWKVELDKMDSIIVPNEFCKKVFLNAGVTKPITVIPHGVDTELFTYKKRPKKDVFVFGINGYFDLFDRKGVFDTIRAFSSEFAPNEPVMLVIHSSNPTFGYYSRFADNRIVMDTRQLSFTEVRDFYHNIDCFVFPSKAEGIGYPPREAMATGLPTIVTNWSGLEDIANPDICYPLTPRGFEPRPDFIHQTGNWALIDIQELMGTMRHIYEHQDEARAVGNRAHEVGQASWPDSAQLLVNYLKEVSN